METNLVPQLDTERKIIIMGDFNTDLKKQQTNFLNFMKNCFQCKQILENPTTIYGTQIDQIHTNVDHIQSGVLEAYWSDHKMIYATIAKD